jgi:O-antigen ligase
MQESSRPGETAVPWLLGTLLVFAPLFRSGQPALALLVLELLAVFLLVLVLWQPRGGNVTRAEAVALGLLFVVPLLYLIPFPAGLTQWIPGREAYRAAQALMTGAPADGAATLSLYPLETESAWLLLLVPIAVFLGTRMLDAHRAFRLVLLVLGIAAAQSLLGLMQYGAYAGSPQLFGLSLPEVRSAIGTYTNRNHLAGLLELVFPVAIALMIFSIGRRQEAHEAPGWRERIAFVASAGGHAAFVYGAISLLLIVGVIFTRSRGGIALSMLGIVLATVLFARRIGGGNVYGPTGTIVALAVGIGVAIGLVPVLDRFSAEGAIYDARWNIFSATLDGIGVFNPVGSGLGNYPDIFPAFRPTELGRWFINHAHNDYLEWLFEGGLVAGALIVLLLALFVRQWGRVWTREEWSRFRFVQVGAGIGASLLMLHSLIDYNLHIPANIAYFAFMTGIFFAEPGAEVGAPGRKRRRRRTTNLEDGPIASEPAAEQAPVAPHPDQISNPFLD